MSPHARNLSRLAVKSMKKAVLKVVQEHKKNGATLSIWKDGKIVQVPEKHLPSKVKGRSTSNKALKRKRLRRSA